MRNPFAGLRPVLEAILREGRVLPATGQAMEDLVRPDHEEVVDRLRSGDDVLDVILETPNRKTYVAVRPIHRDEKHLLRYFLDGSARTFFLGDVVEGRHRSPIHIAQIGAVAVHRMADGRVKIADAKQRIVLMMDKNAVSFGNTVERLVQEAGDQFQFHDTMEVDGETEVSSPGKEPRSRAAHKAHHLMAMLEDSLGRTLDRRDGGWLVLDGNLGNDLYKWTDVHRFFGVAKTFSRQPRFALHENRGIRTVNLYELLADLPFSSRTCAFAGRGGKAIVWYVRIREQGHLDYPLMGVVKVEYPNPGSHAAPSTLIDEISGALVAERQVAPHGKDERWHSHLYAVYLAEQAVKNGFISMEALKAGLRWPALSH